MEYTSLGFVCVNFVLLIYIVSAMPTKKDLRKLADGARPREAELGRVLRERVGAPCELVLSEPGMVAGGMRLAGTVRDVDDEWVLVDCPAKKGGVELKILRISHVEGVESA